MEKLAANLLEELNCEAMSSRFRYSAGVGVSESTVVTWVIMAVLTLLAWLMTRNLKVDHISKRQAAVESAVLWLNGFVEGMIGEGGRQYVPGILSQSLSTSDFLNVIGLFGFKPPTKDMNVTVALALMSIALIQASGIREKGGERNG